MANNGNSGFGMGAGFGMNQPQGFGIQGGNGVSRRGGNFDPREDAAGFINLYLPGPGGDMVKVGKGIPVRKGYGMERQLAMDLEGARQADIAAKQADPTAKPTNLAELLSLILENAEIRWVPMVDDDQQQAPQGFQLKRKTQP